jgi:hypothetical protein
MSDPKAELQQRRKDIRNAILGAKPDRRALTLFGQEVELVQPPLGVILSMQRADDTGQSMAETIIRYIFVPGTNTPVFEEADASSILQLPFGPDLQRLQTAIGDLTGIETEIVEQAKNFVSGQVS